ncbi:MAG: XisH family protein [Lewinellaceae bacterium]|nr:XisH family protein [Lewinellaceae bacterium]
MKWGSYFSPAPKYHDIVRAALERDGWLITDDPLRIEVGDRTIKIDLGAERLIAAEKGEEKIAVEIKSFVGVSQLQDFYMALGQFSYYQVALEKTEPSRELFLAVPDVAYSKFFKEPMTAEVARRHKVRLLVYEILGQKIILWER